MKKISAKVLKFFLVGLFTLTALVYLSGNGHLFGLAATIMKTKRASAGIDDYLFFDNRQIPPSTNPQSWPLHSEYNNIEPTKKLLDTHRELGTVAFMIVKNDSIWHEQYFDGYGISSKSNSFSMSKSMVAAALQSSIESGAVKSLDQKAMDFLPWLKGPYADQVTMGDLASMASGLDWNENYDNLLTITPRTYVEKDMGTLMKTIPIIDPPGQKFVYQSGSTQLLGMALEQATGKNISQLVWSYFWNPIGAEQEAYWQIDSQKAGLEKAYCCFNSNARDFARFGKLFKDYGKWNGAQIIDSSFVTKAINPRFSESPQYGYGWWLGEINEKAYFSMRGHLGQYVIVFPEQNVIVVRLGHRHLDDLPGQQLPEDLPIYIQEAFQMLGFTDES
jgi:CubicO group peptidase (beta-lactamase class C family)